MSWYCRKGLCQVAQESATGIVVTNATCSMVEVSVTKLATPSGLPDEDGGYTLQDEKQDLSKGG